MSLKEIVTEEKPGYQEFVLSPDQYMMPDLCVEHMGCRMIHFAYLNHVSLCDLYKNMSFWHIARPLREAWKHGLKKIVTETHLYSF